MFIKKMSITTNLTKLIEAKKSASLKAGMINTVRSLDSLLKEVNSTKVSRSLARQVKNAVSLVDKYDEKSYDDLAAKAVNKCTSLVKGETTNVDKLIDASLVSSEERIIDLENAIRLEQKELNSTIEKMDECLGEDKIRWMSLNRKKVNIQSRLLLLNQQYSGLVNANKSLVIAEGIKAGQENAQFIEKQEVIIDVDKLSNIQKDAQEVFDGVSKKNAQLENLVYGECSSNSLEDEYERALEEKAKNTPKKSKPALSDKKNNLTGNYNLL